MHAKHEARTVWIGQQIVSSEYQFLVNFPKFVMNLCDKLTTFFSLFSRLLVGAPLGQNLQPNTSHSGALFKCPITQNTNDCVQIITDGRRCKFYQCLNCDKHISRFNDNIIIQ